MLEQRVDGTRDGWSHEMSVPWCGRVRCGRRGVTWNRQWGTLPSSILAQPSLLADCPALHGLSLYFHALSLPGLLCFPSPSCDQVAKVTASEMKYCEVLCGHMFVPWPLMPFFVCLFVLKPLFCSLSSFSVYRVATLQNSTQESWSPGICACVTCHMVSEVAW